MARRITKVDTGQINWSEVSSLNDVSGFGRLTDGRSPNTYLDTSTMEYRSSPRFTQTLGAYFGFTYSPAKDWLIQNIDPDLTTIDKSYDYTKDMEGWEDWDEYLRNANNQTHMDFLKKTIVSGQKRREILSDSGFWQNLIVGFFDPINIIALPFGGPTVGILRSSGRVSAGVTALTLGQETIRVPFDPNATFEESLYMVGAGAVIGGVFGGAIGAGITFGFARNARKKVVAEIQDHARANDIPSPNDIRVHNQARIVQRPEIRDAEDAVIISETPLKDVDTKDLIKTNKQIDNEIFGQEKNIEARGNELNSLISFGSNALKDHKKNSGNFLSYPSFAVWKRSLRPMARRRLAEDERAGLQGEYEKRINTILKGHRPVDWSQSKLNTNLPDQSIWGTKISIDKATGNPKRDELLSYGRYARDDIIDVKTGRLAQWYYDPQIGWQKLVKPEPLPKGPKGKRESFLMLQQRLRFRSTGDDEFKARVDAAKQAHTKQEDLLAKRLNEVEELIAKKVAKRVNEKTSKQLDEEIEFILKEFDGLPQTADDFKAQRNQELKLYVEEPVQKYVRKLWDKGYFPFASSAYRGKQGVRYREKHPSKGDEKFMPVPQKELKGYMGFLLDDDGKLLSRDGSTDISTSINIARERLESAIITSRQKISDLKKEKVDVKREILKRQQDDIKGSPNYTESIFTTGALSWAFKAVVTPMKEILISNAPKQVKLITMKLANDNAMQSQMHALGETTGHSVYVLAKLHEGRMKKFFNEFSDIWNKERMSWIDYNYTNWMRKGKKLLTKRDEYDFNQSTMEEFFNRVTRKYILNDKDLTPEEKQGVNLMASFWESFKPDLIKHEVIGNLRQKKIHHKRMLDLKEELLEKLKLVNRRRKKYLEKVKIPLIKAKIDDLEYEIKLIEHHQGLKNVDSEEGFYPRYFDYPAIERDPDKLMRVLIEWFSRADNNIIYSKVLTQDKVKGTAKIEVKETRWQQTEEGIANRAKIEFEKIMGMKNDPLDPEAGFFGAGVSKHLRHRTVDIPNSVLIDFIVTDPMPVVQGYIHRTMPVVEFRRKFGNRDEREFFEWVEDIMVKNNASPELIQSTRANLQLLYDRIAGRVLAQPDRLDTRVANGLRIGARFSYLGQAGLAAISEVGAIVLNHELKTMRNTLLDMMDSSFYRTMSKKEIEQGGELLDIFKGTVGQRMADDFAPNVLTQGFWDKAQHVFFKFNGLGPMTYYLKFLDGTIRGSTIMQHAIKAKSGKRLDPEEIRWLAQYGMTPESAAKLADEPYTVMRHGSILVDTSKWKNADNIENYRGALSSGILNTIMMSTPADRPKMMDGMIYVPYRIAKNFGYKEDPRVKGYSRMESGLLALPFQFYTYAFATVNKITMSYATGAAKNRAVAALIAIGLGYLSVKLKTPDWAWDNMDYEDRFFRAFDASGTAALYSDLYYTSMHTINAMGGPDIGMGFIDPKFKDTQVGALIGLTGAGPSLAQDYFLALNEFATGDTGKGFKDIMSATGISRFYWFRDSMQELARTIDQKFD